LTSVGVYEYWIEQQADRPGIRRDDKYDLVPAGTLVLNPEEFEQELSENAIDLSRGGRAMKTTINPKEETIYALDEPYPTECYNHGQLSKQTQRYYMCKSLKPNSSTSQAFRVTKETYDRVLTEYADQYSCYVQTVEKNVCVCPKGTIDSRCETETQQKCAITILDPNFAQGCEDKPDSFYYLYSVPGFSPCYP